MLNAVRGSEAGVWGVAWFGMFESNDVSVFDGDATGTGGGADLELANTSTASGQTVNIKRLGFGMPASE